MTTLSSESLPLGIQIRILEEEGSIYLSTPEKGQLGANHKEKNRTEAGLGPVVGEGSAPLTLPLFISFYLCVQFLCVCVCVCFVSC